MPTMTPLESTPVSTDLKITQTRVIRAPRARVYEAWTNPEVLKQWFGSEKSYCSGVQMDARVGGAYRIEMTPREVPVQSDGTECGTRSAAAFGHFSRVVLNERVQFTWASDWFPDEETMVTVTLKDVAEGTELTLVHERFQTEASRNAHAAGWEGALPNLAKVLEA